MSYLSGPHPLNSALDTTQSPAAFGEYRFPAPIGPEVLFGGLAWTSIFTLRKLLVWMCSQIPDPVLNQTSTRRYHQCVLFPVGRRGGFGASESVAAGSGPHSTVTCTRHIPGMLIFSLDTRSIAEVNPVPLDASVLDITNHK